MQASDFQQARAFLEDGGQKGPQRKILRDGAYTLNLAQFVVLTKGANYALTLDIDDSSLFSSMSTLIEGRGGFEPVVIKDSDDVIGIVTVHDGPSLPEGEIIAPTVANAAADVNFHNNYQDPEKFLQARGHRGRQHQVLVDGSYYINRLFATVELVRKTVIGVGAAGVIVSFTGQGGQDVSGAEYRHGELVEPGFRGVWRCCWRCWWRKEAGSSRGSRAGRSPPLGGWRSYKIETAKRAIAAFQDAVF